MLVKNCVRCGQDHEVEMKKVSGDPIDDGKYSHYAICPVLNEPIMIEILKTDKKKMIYKYSEDTSFTIGEIVDKFKNGEFPEDSILKVDNDSISIGWIIPDVKEDEDGYKDDYESVSCSDDIPQYALVTLLKHLGINAQLP